MIKEIFQEIPSNRKKSYKKPVLRTIELTAEEVLAGGCKTNSTNGHFTPCLPGGRQPCMGGGS